MMHACMHAQLMSRGNEFTKPSVFILHMVICVATQQDYKTCSIAAFCLACVALFTELSVFRLHMVICVATQQDYKTCSIAAFCLACVALFIAETAERFTRLSTLC